MQLDTVLTDFLAFLQHEQGVTAATYKGYKAQLYHFHRWLTENGYPIPTTAEVNTPTLRRYLYSISGRGLRPRTIRGYIIPLRSLGEFLITNGVWTENPAKALQLPKKDAPRRKVTSEEEITRLLEAVERQRNPRKVAYQRAVLSVLIYGGLRRQELLDLHLSDISLTEAAITVRMGKGQKARRVYVCDACIHALKEWIAQRPAATLVPYLFTYDGRRRMHINGLKSIIEQVKAIAGLADRDHIQPHSLRHAAATRLLQNGADIRAVQSFLGHSSLQVTSVYLHTDEGHQEAVRHLTALRPQAKPQPDNVICLSDRQRQPEKPRMRRRAV